MLTFAYAEAQEIKKDFADVHATYDKFLTLLCSQLETFEQTIATSEILHHPLLQFPPMAQEMASSTTTIIAMTEAGTQSVISSFNTQASGEKASKNTGLRRLRNEYGVAWIMYMRFGRRSEGVKSFRGIFFSARKDHFIPWEVYEASGTCFFLCSLFDP